MVSRFRQRLAARIERRRVAYADANRRLLIAPRPRPTLLVVRRSFGSPVLRQLEDRRTFHPAGRQRPAAGFFMARHRLRVVNTARASTAPYLGDSPSTETFSPVVPIGVGFVAPRQVAICIRRKSRREVMHAKGYAGGKVRRPTRNEYSGVIC